MNAVKKATPGFDEYSRVSYVSPKKFTKRIIRVEERDNRGPSALASNLRDQGIYMINSSYTHAANPNSMRDFGGIRNVIYNIRQGRESEALSDDSEI